MKRRAIILLVLCALVACGKGAPPPERAQPAAQRPPQPDVDSDNLLSLAYGASVVSRTGEANLERSAAHAIDGLSESVWVSSPGWPNETLVYSLLAPAKIARAGVTVIKDTEVPRRVILESSMDGKQWSELAVIEPQNVAERQLADANGKLLQYLRVRPNDSGKYYVRLGGIHVIGVEVAPPDPAPFTGCWTINGWRAEIVQDGARITGTIHSDPPIHLDGGTDNRAAAVMWLQGPMWGYAVLTRTPDGTHLTGLRFHEEIDKYHLAEGWFGKKCGTEVRPSRVRPPADFLRRAGRYSAFGLAFDREGRLIEPVSGRALETLLALQPRRIVVRDFSDAPERVAAAKAATLRAALQARGAGVARIEFVAAGSKWDGPAISSSVQRLLASRVDIIPPP